MANDGFAASDRFQDIVHTEEELRAAYGQPEQHVLDKVVRVVDEHCQRFIAASPFMVIATLGPDGLPDVSPKGDPAGFVRVLDDKTLAIPDRPGNNRVDTFRNIIRNQTIGLIFFVPRSRLSLRVSGKAIIVRDQGLRDSMAVNGKVPTHAIVVSVERVLFHCGKSLIRSKLWDPDSWSDKPAVPSLAETLIAHAKLAEPVEKFEAIIDESYRETLY